MNESTIWLTGLYVACELIANVTAIRPVTLPGGIVVPAAVFVYALTFTLLDLVNERLGKTGARQVVYVAFGANLLLAAYVQFTLRLPAPAWYAGRAAFDATLGATGRVVAASLAAYLVASLLDVQVFAWWRARVGRHRWARVLASNAVSTLVDSAVFVTLAFAGTGMPVAALIRGQYVVKMAVTVVSVPAIYAVRREKEWGVE
jgi:uncharacterized integral membrane protein (TIGR00697 family)